MAVREKIVNVVHFIQAVKIITFSYDIVSVETNLLRI